MTHYVCITTLGAFLYAQGRVTDTEKRLFDRLFSLESSPQLDMLPELLIGTSLADEKHEALVMQLVDRKLLRLTTAAEYCPEGNAQTVLPDLLDRLSRQWALLVDNGGLVIAQHGAADVVSSTLPALASKFVGALEHSSTAISDALGFERALPCIYGMDRKSLVAFLPLKVADETLVLVTQGSELFRGGHLKDLLWVLRRRYTR